MPLLDGPALIENRVQAIRAMHKRVHTQHAQLDLSGGVDSGVLLGLLARAVGPEHLTAVYSNIHSSDDSRQRAEGCAAAFGVALVQIDLSDLFDQLTQRMQAALAAAGADLNSIRERCQRDPTVLGSLRSCLRAPIGRGFNRMTGDGIRHGTGNECEDRFIRFYQKGGDGEVDSNPIDMLGKGEVLQLARALGVPRALIDAIPSPDLHGIGSDHNDEDELLALSGVAWTYSKVDYETGEYLRVGSIERMSRFLDIPFGELRVEDVLFSEAELDEAQMRSLQQAAGPFFPMHSGEEILGFLRSARRLEHTSRHKANPSITSLGTRSELVAAGLLTNRLPEL